MDGELTAVRGLYDRLWEQTAAVLAAGEVQVDPLLQKGRADSRRALTLVARPDLDVQNRIEAFLRATAAVCPDQHFYSPAELHVTVLAIIPGTISWREEMGQWPVYRKILEEVLDQGRAFSVKFRGVTASPEAVLVQGFPQDARLTDLRNALRDALRKQGVGANLDRRYKMTAAHLTVLRFSNPKADWKRLSDHLRAHRETDFGEMRFRSLQLIWSDWCASAASTRTFREYALRD